MKLVLLKTPLGLRMEYEPMAKAILVVNSPGCCSPDLPSLPFRRITRPMFPFDEFEFSPEDGVSDASTRLELSKAFRRNS
jgi:microcystin degradation protein MlrC